MFGSQTTAGVTEDYLHSSQSVTQRLVNLGLYKCDWCNQSPLPMAGQVLHTNPAITGWANFPNSY